MKKKLKIFKNHFKQDLNFFEHPIWFPTTKKLNDAFVYNNGKGFEFTSMNILRRQDVLFLYEILMQLQHEGFKNVIKTSVYKILKSCNISICGSNYKLLHDSLKRWKSVSLKFEDIFYTGSGYGSYELMGILEYVKYNENDVAMEIRFNKNFIDKIKKSSFYRIINVQYYKYIKHPMALRLFEFLTKNAIIRKVYTISLEKLVDRLGIMPDNRKTKHGTKKVLFNSTIIRRVKTGIEYLNKFFSDKDKMKENKIFTGFITSFTTYKNEHDVLTAEFRIIETINIKEHKKKKQVKESEIDAIDNFNDQSIIEKLRNSGISDKGIKNIILNGFTNWQSSVDDAIFKAEKNAINKPSFIYSALMQGWFTNKNPQDKEMDLMWEEVISHK